MIKYKIIGSYDVDEVEEKLNELSKEEWYFLSSSVDSTGGQLLVIVGKDVPNE